MSKREYLRQHRLCLYREHLAAWAYCGSALRPGQSTSDEHRTRYSFRAFGPEGCGLRLELLFRARRAPPGFRRYWPRARVAQFVFAVPSGTPALRRPSR
jgi:hypothetical protein